VARGATRSAGTRTCRQAPSLAGIIGMRWIYAPLGLVIGLCLLGVFRLHAAITDRHAPFARRRARAEMGRYGALLQWLLHRRARRARREPRD
jgi:hypothetical protein